MENSNTMCQLHDPKNHQVISLSRANPQTLRVNCAVFNTTVLIQSSAIWHHLSHAHTNSAGVFMKRFFFLYDTCTYGTDPATTQTPIAPYPHSTSPFCHTNSLQREMFHGDSRRVIIHPCQTLFWGGHPLLFPQDSWLGNNYE